jgi:hypothetical protein
VSAARTTRAALLLALATGAGCRSAPAPAPAADLAALERERDALRARLAELRAGDPRLAQAPGGGVLIGVPVAAATDLVRQLAAGFFDRIRLVLRDLHVHSEGEVTAKVFLAKVKPGRYDLDLRLTEATALLSAGPPEVRFQGRRVDVAVPVSLARGEGRGKVKIRWDSQGVSSAVCGDFEAEQAVAGQVRPRTYRVQGAFDLEVAGGDLVARPRFPDLVVHLQVDPSADTWKGVDALLAARDLKCRTALKVVDIPKILKGLLARGFAVRIPRTLLPAVRFPAGLVQSVVVEGRTYELALAPAGLVAVDGLLWYGASVQARAVPAPGNVVTSPRARSSPD